MPYSYSQYLPRFPFLCLSNSGASPLPATDLPTGAPDTLSLSVDISLFSFTCPTHPVLPLFVVSFLLSTNLIPFSFSFQPVAPPPVRPPTFLPAPWRFLSFVPFILVITSLTPLLERCPTRLSDSFLGFPTIQTTKHLVKTSSCTRAKRMCTHIAYSVAAGQL